MTEFRRDRQAKRLAKCGGDLRIRLAQAARPKVKKVLDRSCAIIASVIKTDAASLVPGMPCIRPCAHGIPVASRVSSMISSSRRPGLKAANPGGRATPPGMRGQVSTSAITV